MSQQRQVHLEYQHQLYQKLMLIAKSHSVEKNQSHYSKERFVEILNSGLGLELSENASFGEIRGKLQ